MHETSLGVSAAPWPAAGTPGFAVLKSSTRQKLSHYFREALQRDVIDTALTHSVDREGGGFYTDLDRRWRPRGAQQRMLEYQARQARSAARLALALPSQAARWQEIALHGFRHLRDVLWDREQGGWYWLTDARGEPLAAGTKHSHSTAYALGACIEIFRATGERAALELANEGFRWLERALHDDEYGGYHGWALREGTAILAPAGAPDGKAVSDPLGHGVGHKDINVTSDLLEMLAETHELLDERELATRRMRELRDCIVRMMTPDGALHYAAHPDWTAVPGLERYGYHMLTAYRLARAAPLLGTPLEEAIGQARLLAAHSLERGWLPGGGIAYAGPASEPGEMEGQSIVVASRQWWVQLESTKVLLLLSVQDDELKRQFVPKLQEHLRFIERECRDHRYGGWYMTAAGDLGRLRRITSALRGSRIKAQVWKDCSHETDVYLTCLRMLAGSALDAPIE